MKPITVEAGAHCPAMPMLPDALPSFSSTPASGDADAPLDAHELLAQCEHDGELLAETIVVFHRIEAAADRQLAQSAGDEDFSRTAAAADALARALAHLAAWPAVEAARALEASALAQDARAIAQGRADLSARLDVLRPALAQLQHTHSLST